MIARAKDEGKRYFAWTAFNAPHDPWHVPPASLHPKTPLPPTGATNRAKFAAMVEALETDSISVRFASSGYGGYLRRVSDEVPALGTGERH